MKHTGKKEIYNRIMEAASQTVIKMLNEDNSVDIKLQKEFNAFYFKKYNAAFAKKYDNLFLSTKPGVYILITLRNNKEDAQLMISGDTVGELMQRFTIICRAWQETSADIDNNDGSYYSDIEFVIPKDIIDLFRTWFICYKNVKGIQYDNIKEVEKLIDELYEEAFKERKTPKETYMIIHLFDVRKITSIMPKKYKRPLQ